MKHYNTLKAIRQSGTVDNSNINTLWDIHLEYFGTYPTNKGCPPCVREAMDKCWNEVQKRISEPGNITPPPAEETKSE